jgi:hypothetical protein
MLAVLGVPTVTRAVPVDRNLELLIDNLRYAMSHTAEDVAFMPIVEEITRKSFPSILTHKLIPIQTMTGPIDQIGDHQVAAYSRRLAARYTFTPAELHPMARDEIGACVAAEIAAETVQDHLTTMRRTASWGPGVSKSNIPEVIRATAGKMRPIGTWAVASVYALGLLRRCLGVADTDAYAPVQVDNVTVYCDAYASDSKPILVGSRDGGMIFAPYVYAQMHRVTDPMTFEPVYMTRTRYGVVGPSHEQMERQFMTLPSDWAYPPLWL